MPRRRGIDPAGSSLPDARSVVAQLASPAALLEGDDHVFTAVSESYRRTIGGRDPIGLPFREVLPELAEQGFADLLDRVVASGEPVRGEGVSAAWDGDGDGIPEERVVDFAYQPVLDARGRVCGVIVQVTDITETVRTERERDFLATASDVLASSLDYDATLSTLTRLAVPGVADWCAVDEILPGGELRRIAVAHPDPKMVELAHILSEKYPPDPDAPHGVPNVIRTGEPELVPDIPDEFLVSATVDEEHLRIVRELGLRSYLVVPLTARGNVLGALTLVASGSGRRFGERDLRLAQELSRRAAIAMDNARLYRESEAARLSLEEQAVEMELQSEELQHQAMQLQESQVDLEAANEQLAEQAAAAEAARQESEEAQALLDAFFAASPVAVGLVDRDLRYRRMNAALAALAGTDPEKAVGRSLREVMPHFAPLVEPHYRRVLETGKPVLNREVTAPRPEGPDGVFLVNYFPVGFSDGEVLGVGVVALDLTGLRRAEERERVFSKVLEDSRNEIYLFDAETLRFERVNRAARENLGYSMEELSEMTPLDLKPEFTPEQFAALVQPLLEGRLEVVRFETRHRRKDGSLYPVDIDLQYSRAGERPLFMALILDITERREAERELVESRERLRAVVDTAVDGIITIDERGFMETVNPAAERIFGYTSEEMVGRNVSMLMPEPYHSEHDGYLERYLRTGERKIIGIGRAVPGRRSDGSTFPLELSVSESVLEGRRFFTGMVRDITERQRAADQLMAAKEAAEQANQAKSQFLTIMSHELRTPLNAIMGYEDILTTEITGPLNPLQKNHLLRIKSGARQLLDLINQILSLARIESGKEEIVSESADLRDLAEESASLIEGLAEQKRLTLRTRLPGDSVRTVTDTGKVRQILLNLLGNAVKFTEEGEVELSMSVAERQVTIRVRDTGPGIPEEMHDRIFEPFVQADLSATRRHGGTGLGLAVSRQLARMLGGDLVIEPGEGSGSTFALTLPIR
jgi:PAS domain S-box-containing protein